MNVSRMFSKMGGQRIKAASSGAVSLDDIMKSGVRGQPDVAALASIEAKKLAVMIWHYHDDDLLSPDAQVELALVGLPVANGEATLRQYRIDAEHSNAFVAWQKMGSPTAPNDRQYEQLLKAGQLAQFGLPEKIIVTDGKTIVKINLPRQAVSLLTLERN